MCEAVKDMIEESRLEGMEKGEEKKARETACILADMGMPISRLLR